MSAASTNRMTIVRMNVAKSEMMFSIPILADIARQSRKEGGEKGPELPELKQGFHHRLPPVVERD
jgi:hypothetical protein